MYEYPPSVYEYKNKVEMMSNTDLRTEIIRVSRAHKTQWYNRTFLRMEAEKRGMLTVFNRYLGD